MQTIRCSSFSSCMLLLHAYIPWYVYFIYAHDFSQFLFCFKTDLLYVVMACIYCLYFIISFVSCWYWTFFFIFTYHYWEAALGWSFSKTITFFISFSFLNFQVLLVGSLTIDPTKDEKQSGDSFRIAYVIYYYL